MRKILLVDDEAGTRSVLERFLVKKGYEVFTASDGEQGINRIREQEFDVVVTDVRMPRRGGLEVVSAAAARDRGPEVIVMTGHSTISDAVESMKRGACDYVCKPFQLADIDRRIEQAFERRRYQELCQGASEADRLKLEFLAVLNHELRTPLTSLMGYTSLLLDGAFGALLERQREPLERMAARADQLLEMIRSLLDLSLVSSGQALIDAQEFDLKGLVAEVAANLEGRARGKGLELTWAAPEGVALSADRAKLKKALVNLVDNGVKFTARGEVSITAEAAGPSLVWITVQDTGIGIKPEDIPLIFQSFRQLEPSLTRTYGGVGIGLTLAKKFIELLGGTIQVRSKAGRGSDFIVALPLRQGGRKGGY